MCVYCGLVNPSDVHFETHNYDFCRKRDKDDRVFYRKDHLRQHLRLVHNCQFMELSMKEWKHQCEDVKSRCGFCDIGMTTWTERVNHLAEHFKEGKTMADWRGNWGFGTATLEMLENSMSPYLIHYEQNSPLPFTTQQAAPYSCTSAFDLIQLELGYFFSTYVDINQCAPPDRLLQLEACCIIFGAEFLQRPLQTNASSWLRDLLMGTEDIAEEARMRPMKNAARSRFTDLRINGKIDIFEDCQLETSLHQYVDVLQLLSLKIGDDELQREACSIVNHMPNASPMFINLLVELIYGSTIWLTSFRLRMGVPTVEASPRPTDIDAGSVVDFENLAGLADIQASDVGNQRTPANEDAIEPMNSSQPIGRCGVDVDTGTGKLISVNDGSIYRGLTRDLSRFVASAMSPINPTRRIPTDGELQFQARWIMYDSDDMWNQTPADNPDWLLEFKNGCGFF
ncbi:hypothetical protein NM208_g5176 [Fusarium decemcellulare]|nr:hypothetical protein NM208_g5176 [Fusarium decemcellulare]